MFVRLTLKKAAIQIRNQARQQAEASPAGSRRRLRAMDLVEKIEPKFFGSIAYVNIPASKGDDVHLVDITETGECTCTCPDAENGNLCKHRIALAASVIRFAAQNGVRD